MVASCQKNDLKEVNDIEEEKVIHTYSCPVVGVTGPNDNLMGQWKLVKSEYIFMANSPIISDYSCHQITYQFQADGVLIISSNHADVQSTETTYELGEPFEHSDPNYKFYMAKAHYLSHWSCAISLHGREMILDGRAVDGPTLHFIRVK